jgi:heterodisulfide reductase subunit B
MNVAYYPGCSLHGTAREYAESTSVITGQFGINLHDLEGWNCCGASSAHMVDNYLAFNLAARNVRIADKTGMDLVVPCAACYQRLKRAEMLLLAREAPAGVSGDYSGSHRIKYLVDFFSEEIGEQAIREKVKRPLDGIKPVCFYGCLAVRPPRVTGTRNPENPVAMDNIVKSLGAGVRDWSYKTDCCGGNLSFTRPQVSARLVDNLITMAVEAGANCIVTGCPLCQSNLDLGQRRAGGTSREEKGIPVFYFTELIGLALGVPADRWWRGHAVDPRPFLREMNLV